MYMLPTAITTGSPFRGKMYYTSSSLRVFAGESPPQLVRVFCAQYLSVHKLKETKHRDHVNLHKYITVPLLTATLYCAL